MNWIFLDSLVWTLASEWDIYRWFKKIFCCQLRYKNMAEESQGWPIIYGHVSKYSDVWASKIKKIVAKNSSNSDEGFSIFSTALFKYYYFQGVIIKQRFGLSFRQEPLLDWHGYRMQWIYINIGSTYIIFLQVHFLY